MIAIRDKTPWSKITGYPSVVAGSGLTGGGSLSGDVTLNVGAGTGIEVSADAVSVKFGSSAGQAAEGNKTITISAGTGLSGGGTITIGAGGSVSLSVEYGSTAGTAVEGNKQITISAGSGLSGGGTITLGAGGTVTLSHADTSSQGSVSNTGGTVIRSVTLDTYGHVTGLTSYNLDNRYYTESEADSKFVHAGITKRLYIETLRLDDTNPPDTGIVGYQPSVDFGPTSDEIAYFNFAVPSDCDTSHDINLRLGYCMSTSGTGTVVMAMAYQVISSGGDATPADTGTDSVTINPPDSAEVMAFDTSLTIPAADIPNNNAVIGVKLYRDANNANDTHGGDFRLLTLEVQYTTKAS